MIDHCSYVGFEPLGFVCPVFHVLTAKLTSLGTSRSRPLFVLGMPADFLGSEVSAVRKDVSALVFSR